MGFRHMGLVKDAAEIAKAVKQKGDPSYIAKKCIIQKSFVFEQHIHCCAY